MRSRCCIVKMLWKQPTINTTVWLDLADLELILSVFWGPMGDAKGYLSIVSYQQGQRTGRPPNCATSRLFGEKETRMLWREETTHFYCKVQEHAQSYVSGVRNTEWKIWTIFLMVLDSMKIWCHGFSVIPFYTYLSSWYLI